MSSSSSSTSLASASAPFHIPSLDGLRAVSILIVFLSHAGLHRLVPGLFGVTVFFFLSGYLITTLLRLEAAQTGGVSLRDFFVRRFLRIFPPFYVVLGLIVLASVAGLLESRFSWTAVFAQALQVANYQEIFGRGGQPQGTEVFWSLAVEEHFYLVFPFLYLGLRRWLPDSRRQALVLGGLALAVLAWRWWLVTCLGALDGAPGATHQPRLCHATDTRLDSLLFGCLLALWGNPALDSTRFKRSTWLGLWLPLGVVALLASFVVRHPVFRETIRYTLQGLALVPVFVVVIRYPEAWGCRFLNWRWVRWIGVLSYPIYLVHSAVIAGVQHAWPAAGSGGLGRAGLLTAQGLIAAAGSLLLAMALHRWVEKPCARWRRRFARVNAPATVQEPGARVDAAAGHRTQSLGDSAPVWRPKYL